MSILVLKSKENPEKFWPLMGPAFASASIRRELGIAMSDNDDCIWFVSVKDNALVGFACLEIKKKGCYFRHAYVVKEERNHGVFSDLLNKRLKHAESLGLPIYVTAAPDIQETYKKQGFITQSTRGKYATMVKELVK